jgi:hypothetical protein
MVFSFQGACLSKITVRPSLYCWTSSSSESAGFVISGNVSRSALKLSRSIDFSWRNRTFLVGIRGRLIFSLHETTFWSLIRSEKNVWNVRVLNSGLPHSNPSFFHTAILTVTIICIIDKVFYIFWYFWNWDFVGTDKFSIWKFKKVCWEATWYTNAIVQMKHSPTQIFYSNTG